ncbi:hypothetical protein ACQ4PT_011019 [Festuca glaucescens]
MAAAAADAQQDIRRWVACAVALDRLPAVGSEVYYFAQGHAEQWPSIAAPQAANPMLACRVTSIQLFTAGEEPYARISLVPANHSLHPAADMRPNPDSFLYFPKPLAQADIQRSYLAVPKVCVNALFPEIEVGSDTQVIDMSGLDGDTYHFQHKVSGRKNDLKGDWARFIANKRPDFGDTVLFVRRSDLSFLIEVRRQQPVVDHGVQQPVEELEQSSHLAAQGAAFTVTYYPGRGSDSPFVVPRGAVDEAMGKQWESGMDVRVRPSDLVLHAEQPQGAAFQPTTGTIRAVTTGLVWRNLQIDLDGSSSSSPSATKSMWQVESVRPHPPLPKRTKTGRDPEPSRDDQSKEPVKKLRLMGFDIIKAKEDIGTS